MISSIKCLQCSFPVESAFIETHMVGLTLPAPGADGKVGCVLAARDIFLFINIQVDIFPSPNEISSDKHKRYWVNNNSMVRGQLVLSHKWMLFIPSHIPAQSAKVLALQ